MINTKTEKNKRGGTFFYSNTGESKNIIINQGSIAYRKLEAKP